MHGLSIVFLAAGPIQRRIRVKYRTMGKLGFRTSAFGLGCGACEDACPQHLPIVEQLQTAWGELT